MNKYELAQKMQEIDQQSAASRRQLQADSYSLQTTHQLFDDIAEESLIQIAMLKGEKVDKKKDTPLILQARLMTDDDEGW